MGKITVKHYLEKRVSPIDVVLPNGTCKKMLPIYVQIIYNKFSTHKRSNTLITSTEKAFENYLQKGILLDNEFDAVLDDCNTITVKGKYSAEESLRKEINKISNSIKIVDDNNYTVDRKDLLEYIDVFSKPVYQCFKYSLMTYYETGYEREKLDNMLKDIDNYDEIIKVDTSKLLTETEKSYIKFLNAFNPEYSILESVNIIKNQTNIDLSEFIEKDLLWKCKLIDFVKIAFWNVSFSEFVYSDYDVVLRKLLKNKTIKEYEKIIQEISFLIQKYIQEPVNFDNYYYRKWFNAFSFLDLPAFKK